MGSRGKILSEAYVAVKGLLRYRGVLFWAIVFPILFYTLMIAIWGGSGVQLARLGVVNNDSPVELANGTSVSIGEELVRALNESGLFKVTLASNVSSLEEQIHYGRLDIGLVIPGNFTRNILEMEPANVEVLTLNTSDGRLQASILEGFLSRFGDGLRNRSIGVAMSIALRYVPENQSWIVSRWFSFIEKPLVVNATMMTPPLLATSGGVKAFYALGMIGVEILFIGLSAGVSSIIDMKREGTLKIILSSPMSPWELLASFTLAGLVVVSVSVVSILAYSLATGAKYDLGLETALATAALLFLAAIFTLGFGLLLAPLARSQEAAMAIVNIIAFPVMFVGGLVVPSFVLPQSLREFARMYPLSRLLEVVRSLLLYGIPVSEAFRMALPAVVATVVVYVVGLLVFVRLLERAVEE